MKATLEHTESEENEAEVLEDGTHTNGVESYWAWMKRRLQKFNGIPKERFTNHMIESEWRCNHRATLAHDLKKLLRVDS